MRPIQTISKDENGCWRFETNKIVEFLLDNGPYDMNDLAVMDFSDEDRMQFAQLIGYSVDGFGSLSYVSNEVYGSCEKIIEGKSESDAIIETLTEQVEAAKAAIRQCAPILFSIHPDDLTD